MEFTEMLEAFVEEEKRQDDITNQRISWFTAHLMNSSGNYRRTIRPTDLYKPLADRKEEKESQKVVERFESPEQKQQYLKELFAKFGKELDGSLN